MKKARMTLKRIVLAGACLVLAVGAAAWFFASHETRSHAKPRLKEGASASERGAAAFEGADFGGLSMATLETHALPWRLVAAALVTHAQSRQTGLPIDQSTLQAELSKFGFLTRAEVANRPATAISAESDVPLGFTFGDLAPIGGAKVRVVNLGCAACHAGVVYQADGQPDPGRAWLGTPNTSLNLEAYTTGVLNALRHALNDTARLLDTADTLYPDMDWQERQTLRWMVVPLVRNKVAEHEGAERPLPFSNGLPGSTNGVAALKFKLGAPLAGGGAGELGIVSVPELGDRHWRTSLLADGAYAVPGKTRQRPTKKADLDARHLQELAAITTFFTVPSMGVHPEMVTRHEHLATDIFTFLRDRYKPQPFPGPVDLSRARPGADIYANSCGICHGTYRWNGDRPELVEFPNWRGEVGTDSLRAALLDESLSNLINSGIYGTTISAMNTGEYVAPPLTGIWASAPYLHNGSVPSIAALLTPGSRPERFQVGGHALDFTRMGLLIEDNGAYPGDHEPFSDPAWFDTGAPGQGNRGHSFGSELSAAQKAQLMEFLKLL